MKRSTHAKEKNFLEQCVDTLSRHMTAAQPRWSWDKFFTDYTPQAREIVNTRARQVLADHHTPFSPGIPDDIITQLLNREIAAMPDFHSIKPHITEFLTQPKDGPQRSLASILDDDGTAALSSLLLPHPQPISPTSVTARKPGGARDIGSRGVFFDDGFLAAAQPLYSTTQKPGTLEKEEKALQYNSPDSHGDLLSLVSDAPDPSVAPKGFAETMRARELERAFAEIEEGIIVEQQDNDPQTQSLQTVPKQDDIPEKITIKNYNK